MTEDEGKDVIDEVTGAESDSVRPGGASARPSGRPDDPSVDLGEARAMVERLRDQLVRTAADYDNFRKRTRRDLLESAARGRDELLRELLPVFDNLERAVLHAGSATDVRSLAEGIDLVMRQFWDTLGRIGIQRIEAVGLPFDPAVHEAIQEIETSAQAPGCVALEIQAGYRAGERLIRPAAVGVAKRPAAPPVAQD